MLVGGRRPLFLGPSGTPGRGRCAGQRDTTAPRLAYECRGAGRGPRRGRHRGQAESTQAPPRHRPPDRAERRGEPACGEAGTQVSGDRNCGGCSEPGATTPGGAFRGSPHRPRRLRLRDGVRSPRETAGWSTQSPTCPCQRARSGARIVVEMRAVARAAPQERKIEKNNLHIISPLSSSEIGENFHFFKIGAFLVFRPPWLVPRPHSRRPPAPPAIATICPSCKKS